MRKHRNILSGIFPVLFIFLLVLSLLGKILLPAPTEVVYGGDLLTQFYFWKGYLAESLKEGFIPFWNPYNFSGTPFLAHPSVAFFYPATILFLLFPLNIAFSLNYFIHLLLAGFGMYWLAKKYMGTFSSLLSSCAFVLSGFFAARIYAGHVDLFTTSVWIPWVFGSIKEVLEDSSRKKIIMAVVFFTLQILAGYQAYVLFTLEFIFAYVIFYIIRHRLFNWQNLKKKVLPALFVASLSVLIAAVSWLPTWQLTKSSIRGEGLPYDLASWGALPVSGLSLFFQPLNRTELNKITFGLGGGPLPNPFDHFTGRLPLAVIFIFLLFKLGQPFFPKWKKKLKIDFDFWFSISICLFYLWISFAHFAVPNLHYLFYQLFPFYRHIRIPIQHLVYLVFLVPLMFGMVSSFVKNNFAKLILLSLLIFELFSFSSRYVFLSNVPEQTYDRNLLSVLKREKERERLLPYFRVISPVLKAMDLNAVMAYKVESTGGYDPVILKNYYRFIDLVNKQPQSSIPYYNVEVPPLKLKENILDYLNVGYILTEKNGLENQNPPSFELVLEGDVYKLYKKEYVWPRFFLIDNVKEYSSSMELQDILINKEPDFSKTILLSKGDLDSYLDLNLECDKSNLGDVKIVSYTPNHVTLKINAVCNSFLSSSEVYYPGWKAKIDDSDTNLLQSNLAFRTIYVPKGEHKIEFFYYPEIYFLGIMLSSMGIILIVVCRKY